MKTPQVGMLGLALTAVALVVTSSVSCSLRMAGGPTGSVQTEQEIRLLESRLREAALAGATAVLNDLLADDYTNTDAYGVVRHKTQVIADVESGNSSFEAIGLDDISVSLYGDAAVLTAKRTVRGRAAGRDPSGQFRQIRVYAKRQGRWQAVMLQITRIAGS
jgi:ketosteroid isomerase-like protein